VSRAASRVRRPGSFTCARCPVVAAALDAVPEAYHNPAAIRWGATVPGHVAGDQAVLVKTRPRVSPANSLGGMITSLEGRGWRKPTARIDAPPSPLC